MLIVKMTIRLGHSRLQQFDWIRALLFKICMCSCDLHFKILKSKVPALFTFEITAKSQEWQVWEYLAYRMHATIAIYNNDVLTRAPWAHIAGENISLLDCAPPSYFNVHILYAHFIVLNVSWIRFISLYSSRMVLHFSFICFYVPWTVSYSIFLMLFQFP